LRVSRRRLRRRSRNGLRVLLVCHNWSRTLGSPEIVYFDTFRRGYAGENGSVPNLREAIVCILIKLHDISDK
jgi:hypothetical protein